METLKNLHHISGLFHFTSGDGIIIQLQNTSSYHRMKKEKDSSRAIIALTREVARIVFAMLNNHEEFNPALMP